MTNIFSHCPRAVRAAAMGLAFGVAGCSMFVSHEEVALYRRIRTTGESNARLVAMAEYATRYGDGAWITSIRAEREANEGQVWASNGSSADGLAFYLQAYPDGTYVEQARARQTALQQVNVGREETQQRQVELEQQQAQRQAEERRQWVTRAAQFWMRTLVGVRNYGSPIGQVARRAATGSSAKCISSCASGSMQAASSESKCSCPTTASPDGSSSRTALS
jgi:hypothetical protein